MYHNFKSIAIIILIITAFNCFSGCQNTIPENKQVEKEGRLCGLTKGAFRHRWWNYYERGISFQDCQYWKEAEADLRQALKSRDKDERRARTYGMHFIDYFPHRELGISLFHQKRYEDAVRELEISLSSETSAKAEFYMDKSRKALIEQNNIDISPPDISIESPGHETFTKFSVITVSGIVKDDTFIKEIRVNGKSLRIDLSAPQLPFKTEIPVSKGLNAVIVEAEDLTGKKAQKIRNLLCDRTGPVLNIEQVKSMNGSGRSYLIKGTAFDDMGIKQLWVNNEKILNQAVPEAVFNHTLTLSSDRDKVIIIAEDPAGNRTIAEINPKKDIHSADYHNEKPLLASLDIFPIPLCLRNKENGRYYAASPIILPVSERKLKFRIRKYKKEGTDYALIIGINQYQYWNHLQTAVNDAEAMRDILMNQYGFLKDNIILKTDKDASGSVIIKSLRQLAGSLTEKDNLLIYFAGHGQLDELTEKGYWIPVEGRMDDPMTWIANHDIRDILNSENVLGKNIIVITDSCYSGSLLRGASPLSVPGRNYQIKLLEQASKRSRQVIASGGLQPVADGGRNNHSLFAYYLLKALEENEAMVIDMESLFVSKVKMQVAQMGTQRPEMGRLKTPMDEDGQFILVRSETSEVFKTSEVFDTGITQAAPAAPGSLFTGKERDADSSPPAIELKRWDEKQTVFVNEAYIGGRVSDENGVYSMTINGQKIIGKPSDNVYFHYLAGLNPGDNPFVIECMDKPGNKARKEINIHREMQEIYETGSRMAVVQFPFTEEVMDAPEIKNILHRELSNIERFNMKRWIQEEDKQSAPDKIRIYAKELNGEFWLEGRIIRKEKSLEISAGIYEIDNSDILTVQDVYGEDLSRDSIEKMCHGLMIKLRDEFPRIEGKVIKIKGEKITINKGKRDGLKKGMRLIIFQEGEPMLDPDTGEVLEEAEIEKLATAKIIEVREKISIAEPIDKYGDSILKPGLKLVMK